MAVRRRRAIRGLFSHRPWAQFSYVDPAPNGAVVVLLARPFETRDHGAAAQRWIPADAELGDPDSPDDPVGSNVLVYEDGRLLGPSHASHRDIFALGQGRYSHWRGQRIIFSASDDTDPNTNGRRYWAVKP